MSLLPAAADPLLPLRAGLAVADVAGPGRAGEVAQRRAATKGRKVAGVLVEARPHDGWAVLGIGLNAAVELDTLPEEVRVRAATLGRPPSALEATLAELLAALQDPSLAEPAGVRRSGALRERDALVGRPIRWEGGEGAAAGIAADGALLVRTPGRRAPARGGRGPPRRGRDRGPGPLSPPCPASASVASASDSGPR